MQSTHDLKDSSYCHNSKACPLSIVLGNDCDTTLKEEKLLLLFPETRGGGGAFNSGFRFSEVEGSYNSDSQESGDSLGVSRGTVMAPAQKRDRLPLLPSSPPSQAQWKDAFIQCLY